MMVKRRYIPHPEHVPFEYTQITSHIYVGTNQCCQSHFEQSLLAEGISADISLEQDKLDAPFGVSYYLWLPVPDQTPPSVKQLLIGAKLLKELVDNDTKVYVHCKRGHGRSPTLVAAYFILEGFTAREAIGKIREKRNIHLRMSQIGGLKEFQKVAHSAHIIS